MTENRAAGATGDGVVYDPLSAEQMADPYPVYARLRMDDPIHRSDQYGLWFILGHDDVRSALLDTATFSSETSKSGQAEMCPHAKEILASGPIPPPTLVDLDPPGQTNNKRPVQRALSTRRIRQMEPRVEEIVQRLVDRFAARGSVEFVSELARPLPVTVVATLLGFPEELHGQFQAWANDLALGLSTGLTEEQQVQVATSQRDLRLHLQQMISDRRREAQDDLMSELVAATRPDGTAFRDEELIGMFETFVTAGHETTTNLLSGMMHLLATRPDVVADLRADPGLIDNFIEESLRYVSPVQARYRKTTADVELHGRLLHAQDRLQVSFASANHDDTVFVSPEEFDVRREIAAKHFAFGFGAHICVGAELARLEARTALRLLLSTMNGPRVDPDRGYTRLKHFHLRGLSALHIQFDPAD